MPRPPATEADLRDRARRGQLRSLLALVPGIGIVAPVFTYFGFRRHSESLGSSVVPALVGACVGLGFTLLVSRRRRGDPYSLYAPVLVRGLPLSGRRAVRRAIRRGEPSDDHLLRLAADDSARRAVRTFALTLAVGAIGTAVFTAIMVSDADLTVFGRCCSAALAVGALVSLLWTIDQRRRAPAYLAASGRGGDLGRPPDVI